MQAALGLSIALAALGCDAESQVAPRTPVNADLHDPVCVRAPAIDDRFSETFARYQDGAYHVDRPRSIDLGPIGDSPLGRDPPRPHTLPPWQQPFPCDWTNTCPRAPLFYPAGEPYGVLPVYAR